MPAGIDPAKVIEFSGQVHVAAQQMTSRMRNYVQTRYIKGEDYAYDGIDDVEAIEITSRLQNTQGQTIDNNRRKIHMREFRATLLLDRKEQLEVIFDPKNQYAQAVARAMYRKFDRVALSSAFADVQTGKNFGTTITFAQDGGLTVDATGGFTYEKLQEIEANFEGNEVGTEMEEKMFGAISEQEKTDLLGENELISTQVVTTGRTGKNGSRLMEAGPFDIVTFGSRAKVPQLQVNAGVRDNVFGSARGICVGISEELNIEINQRADKNNAWQVQASMMMGAVRTEGKLINKVQTTAR